MCCKHVHLGAADEAAGIVARPRCERGRERALRLQRDGRGRLRTASRNNAGSASEQGRKAKFWRSIVRLFPGRVAGAAARHDNRPGVGNISRASNIAKLTAICSFSTYARQPTCWIIRSPGSPSFIRQLLLTRKRHASDAPEARGREAGFTVRAQQKGHSIARQRPHRPRRSGKPSRRVLPMSGCANCRRGISHDGGPGRATSIPSSWTGAAGERFAAHAASALIGRLLLRVRNRLRCDLPFRGVHRLDCLARS